MAYAKYIGHKVRQVRNGVRVRAVPQDEHSTTTAFGTDFPRGYWVPLDHLEEAHQDKLAGNPGFVVAAEPPSGEPVIAPEDVVSGPAHSAASKDPWADAEDVDEPQPKATMSSGKGKGKETA